jgi:hypothetical protein
LTGDHSADGGPRLRVDDEGRGYWSRCSCGWESELFATPAMVDAVVEQHVLFANRRHDDP